MTELAEQVLKILRRMEPSTAVRNLKAELNDLTDEQIVSRCEELGIELDSAALVC